MRNQLYLSFLCFGVLLNLTLKAQSNRSVVFKVDAVEALKKQLAVGIEWRTSAKGGLELQLGFQRHGQIPVGVFNGDWTTEYVERRTYILLASANSETAASGWEYLGSGRPLPGAPPAINPISTLYTRLGYAISFQNKPHGLRFILIPGFSLLRSRYFEVKDKTVKGETATQSWQLGATLNEQQLVEQTISYTQLREMRERNKWIGGGTYAFGLAWQAKSGISLEARITVGANFGEGIYVSEKPSPLLGNFYGQGAFFVGWAF